MVSGNGDPPSTGDAPVRRYATTAAFEAALKASLRARATKHRTIQDLRKLLAFDRVLARLRHVAPDAWLLKGGVALEYRLQRARATTDIDISTQVGAEEMIDVLDAAATVDLHDYFALRVGERSKPVDEVETYRFKIAVLYENARVFEELKIDVGFADPWLGEPQELTAPPLLDFARIEPATVRAIPIEQHLTEKIHAYTKRYGNYDSTRVKDLIDIALLICNAPINDQLLARMLREVFDRRGTHQVPSSLPPPPPAWRAAYARLAAGLPIPQTSDESYHRISEALSGVLGVAVNVAGTPLVDNATATPSGQE
jgi:hypothetical protein